jgi:hypothetical protein
MYEFCRDILSIRVPAWDPKAIFTTHEVNLQNLNFYNRF